MYLTNNLEKYFKWLFLQNVQFSTVDRQGILTTLILWGKNIKNWTWKTINKFWDRINKSFTKIYLVSFLSTVPRSFRLFLFDFYLHIWILCNIVPGHGMAMFGTYWDKEWCQGSFFLSVPTIMTSNSDSKKSSW